MEALGTREVEILSLISEGLTNREIAQRLVLSPETIKWYNKQIYSKLGVSSRTQAVNKAQEYGLLGAEDTAEVEKASSQSNLPAQVTSFVGRVQEIAEIKKLLDASRLVVLTGAGGSGKSRLALQVAGGLVMYYREGVWLVELATIKDPAQVADAIAHMLRIKPSPEIQIDDILKRYLAHKHLLLVLDNFEHLLEAAPLVGELLAAAPQLSVLATSRERLHVYGEQEYQVNPLKLPKVHTEETFEQLQSYDAIELFIQRAQTAQPRFVLDDDQVSAVVQICRRLDGLPLAIELAAARTKMFAPKQLLGRLESRLGMLISGPRDVPARQRTLRDTIDWSYNLLNEDEKRLFARLGVFSGGSSIRAVEAVCGPGLQGDTLEGLESLLNKNLLYHADSPEGGPRFFMLETVHEYARGRLEESGEEQLIRDRHLKFFLELAEEARPHFLRAKQAIWLDRLEIEYDNLRAALSRTRDVEGEAESGLRLVVSLEHFWTIRGYLKEGREHLSKILSKTEALEKTESRAKALNAAGHLAYLQSDYPATENLIGDSLAIYRLLGRTRGTDYAHALITLGDMKTELGDYAGGSALMSEALEIMRELSDLPGITRALWQLGACAIRPGDFEQAVRYLEEALPLAMQTGDKSYTGIVLTGLAEVAIRQGEYERATKLEEESLSLRREIGDTWGIGVSLGNFGWIALLQRDLEQAVDLLQESLKVRLEIGDRGGIAWCLEKLAETSLIRGQEENSPQMDEYYRQAVRLFGAAQVLRSPLGSVIDLVDQPGHERQLANLQSRLDSDAFSAAWSEGQKMTMEQAVAYAVSDPVLGV